VVKSVKLFTIVVSVAVLVSGSRVWSQNEKWNSAGLAQNPNQATSSKASPAPRRDLTGIWDAGRAGISPRGYPTPPLTPRGEEVSRTHKSGDGARMASIVDINDPLSTLGDPAGFPRLLLFELRPFQIVRTPNQVLMLYMFEKRWRVIWTDGRQLPKDPVPRWYGYSVGKWEDDTTFVVQSVGTDQRTWLDNAGNPHSANARVEERYHRTSQNTLELTVTIDDPDMYTKSWVPRDRLPLALLPPDTDLMEMIPSASEAAEYRKVFAGPSQ
jgi:hypothetical protein